MPAELANLCYMGGMKNLSQITAVKGRLPHVQARLSRWLQSGVDELLLVTYGDSATAGWLLSPDNPAHADPRLTVVDVPLAVTGPTWCAATAKNIGAAAARGSRLLFVDADAHTFGHVVDRIRDGRSDLWFTGPHCWDRDYPLDFPGLLPPGHAVDGQLAISASLFRVLNGFSVGGWGVESYDLCCRAGDYGATAGRFAPGSFSVAAHGDDLRDAYLPDRLKFSSGQRDKVAAFRSSWRSLSSRRVCRASPGRALSVPAGVTLYRGGRVLQAWEMAA